MLAAAWSLTVPCSVSGGSWSVSDRENTRLHGLAHDGPLWRWVGAGYALAGSLIRLAAEHVQQHVEVERLGEELDRVAGEGAGFVFAADGDDALGAVGVGQGLAVLEQLEAVHLGHAQVG